MQLKVLAYITRQHQDTTQLLVFTHRDHPDAGLQIPAGTVEDGEEIENALFREIQEESGLTEVKLIRKLAVFENTEWGNIRHVFHLVPTKPLPDSWDWLTNDYHDEASRARDERLVFCYHWEDLKGDIELAAQQGMWLQMIED
jgi:ADP-ribose pyrophosphatase YjhB (NUDIX family)